MLLTARGRGCPVAAAAMEGALKSLPHQLRSVSRGEIPAHMLSCWFGTVGHGHVTNLQRRQITERVGETFGRRR